MRSPAPALFADNSPQPDTPDRGSDPMISTPTVEFPHSDVVSFLRAEIFDALRHYGYEHPEKDAPIRNHRVGIDVDVQDDVVYARFPDEAAADEARRLMGRSMGRSTGASIAAIVLAVHEQENRKQVRLSPHPTDRKSTRLNSSHDVISRMPSSA